MAVVQKVKRKVTQRPEQALQRIVADYLDVALPHDAVWFHTPNGGYRSPVEGAIFKGLGVKPGVADITIFWQRRAYCIELKSDGGKLSDSQRAWHARLQTAGIPVETARTLKEVATRLYEFGIPLRSAA